MALNFNQFASEPIEFIQYTKALDLNGIIAKARRILSSVLHGLREIISVEESLQFIAQFPIFLKAVYVNSWSTHKKHKVKNMKEFIDPFRKFCAVTKITDFKTYELTEQYIHATFIMLHRFISSGELDDIRSEIPKELKTIVYHKIKI